MKYTKDLFEVECYQMYVGRLLSILLMTIPSFSHPFSGDHEYKFMTWVEDYCTGLRPLYRATTGKMLDACVL